MGLSKSRLYQETLKAAFAFQEKALWKKYDNAHVFAVKVTGEERPVFVCILGAGGDEFGLCLYLGENAWQNLCQIFIHDACDDDMLDEIHFLGFSMQKFGDIPPANNGFLDKANFFGGKDALVPLFATKSPGKRLRDLNRREVELFLRVMNGIMKAAEEGILTVGYLGSEPDTLTLTISGGPLTTKVTASRVDYGSGESTSPSPTVLSLPRALPSLQNLPRSESHWLAAFPILPAPLNNSDKSVRGIMVIDAELGTMLQFEPLQGSKVADISDAFFAACQVETKSGKAGLPAEVTFTSRTLMAAVSPTLSLLGVKYSYDEIPMLAELIANFYEDFLQHLEDEDNEDEDEGQYGEINSDIYQLKITLQGIRPPVWRRVLVPGNVTLGGIHFLIQAAMGWTDSHLHMFETERGCFADPLQELEDTDNEDQTCLSEVLPQVKDTLSYTYDFGDDWQHQIQLEKILPVNKKQTYPVCVKGKRACPPEDCGGILGYQDLSEVVRNPKHKDYAEQMEWLGEAFDPEAFDLDEINARLQAKEVAP